MDFALDGFALGVVPPGADPVALELREGQHQPQDEPAVIGAEVELVLNGDQAAGGAIDALDMLQRVLEGAAEAVELGDDDPIAQPGLDAFDRFDQKRSVRTTAGLVELLEYSL